MSDSTKSSGGNSGKIIVIVIFILALLGINGYQFFKAKKDGQAYQETIVNKDAEIEKGLQSLDSLQSLLEARKIEIEELGGNIEELNARISELEAEKEKFRKSSNIAWGKVNRLERLKNDYMSLLSQKDDEISAIKSQRDSLYVDKKDLLVRIDSINTEKNGLQTDLDASNQLVKLAQTLKAEDFRYIAISAKGKEKPATIFKAKHIDQLKIEFKLAENKVAEIENKEVFIQIQDGDGTTIYDLDAGSGSFDVDGQEQYYTIKNDVLYNQSGTNVVSFFKKGSPFDSGTHTVKIYCEGYLIGSSTFGIK